MSTVEEMVGLGALHRPRRRRAQDEPVAPCAACGDTGGRPDRPGRPPARRDGARVGLTGGVCLQCYARAYDKERRPQLARGPRDRRGQKSGGGADRRPVPGRVAPPKEEGPPESDLRGRVWLKLQPHHWAEYLKVRKEHIANLEGNAARWLPPAAPVWLF